MDKHYHRHTFMKFVVVCIFMFMAFWLGVQLGEVRGALGFTPMSARYGGMNHGMMSGQMMNNWNTQGGTTVVAPSTAIPTAPTASTNTAAH